MWKCNKIILDSLDYCPTCKINDNKIKIKITNDLDKVDKGLDEIEIFELSTIIKFILYLILYLVVSFALFYAILYVLISYAFMGIYLNGILFDVLVLGLLMIFVYSMFKHFLSTTIIVLLLGGIFHFDFNMYAVCIIIALLLTIRKVVYVDLIKKNNIIDAKESKLEPKEKQKE